MKPASYRFDKALLQSSRVAREKRKDQIAWRRIKKLKKESDRANQAVTG